MADYGDFRFGSGTEYGSGAVVPMPTPTSPCIWILSVDWDNNGSYDGTNEAQWLSELVSFRRGRDHYISQGGNDFERMQMGKAILRMDNSERRYDPYNTSSALYPNVVPGRRAQLAVRYVATGVTYVLLTGFIEDIRPVNDDRKHIYIDLVDGWKSLGEGDISIGTPVYRTSISACINTVLDEADYSGGRAIDSESQPIVRWSPEQENAARTLQKLATASLGNVFVNKNGQFCFYSRSHNSQPTHSLDQTDVLKDIQGSMPWENVRNEVTCIAIKPFKGELKQIMALPSPIKISIPSSTWRTFTLELDREYIDVTFGGLEANSLADNSGIWITNVIDYTVSIGAKSITISVSTPVNGYITAIDLKGREYVTRKMKFYASDTSSRAAYGNRRFILESDYLQNINHAEAFATIIKDALKDPSKAPRITIQGRPDIQYAFDLLDKVTFVSSTLEISDTFYVGSIELRWLKEGGQSVQTILSLTPLIYDTSTISDDPYDPGLPEVPTLPGLPGGPGFPEPIDTPIECKTDREAPPNGPYWLLYPSTAYDLVTNLSTQKQITIPFQTVIRMGTSVYPTKVVLHARRMYWYVSSWYATEKLDFFEVWAIGTDGSELFKADVVTAEGEYITAVFHPEFGTTVGGIRIKAILADDFNFAVGYTFTFASGAQGWEPAPYDGVGDPTLPTSHAENTANNFIGGPGSLQMRNTTNGWFKNSWVYYPLVPVYGQAGASVSGLISLPGNCFVGFGTLYTDGTWEFGAWPGGGNPQTIVKACGAANYGKRVKCFQFNTNHYWSVNWAYLDSVHAVGWDMTPFTTFMLRIYSATISNVCAVE